MALQMDERPSPDIPYFFRDETGQRVATVDESGHVVEIRPDMDGRDFIPPCAVGRVRGLHFRLFSFLGHVPSPVVAFHGSGPVAMYRTC